TDSAQKPLLHLWSLGVEEQFYIVWPLCIYLGWRLRANMLLLILAIAGGSFIINIISGHTDPVGMFYSPLTRFWELLVVAALADLTLARSPLVNPGGLRGHCVSVVGALLLAGGCVLMTKFLLFPGWWALVPVAGAVLLIAAGPEALVNRIVLRNPVM